MAINLSALAPLTTAATALSNLILVSPQSIVGYAPQPFANPNGDGTIDLSQAPPALLFHYEGEQAVTLTSDITDHYIEDNTAIQDQIALRPVIVTTQGFIGELNNVPPFGLQTLKTAADKLTTIGAYAPQVSITAQLAYNEALLAYQVGSNARDAAVASWTSINNLASGGTSNGQAVINSSGKITAGSSQNKQQIMFQQFYGYWQERRLFTVQTPWAVLQNMAIGSLRAVQDPETRVISTFELSFKQIRTALTAVSGIPTSLAGHAAPQASSLVNQGASPGSPGASVGDGIAKTVAP
jgi:hypothetical protein